MKGRPEVRLLSAVHAHQSGPMLSCRSDVGNAICELHSKRTGHSGDELVGAGLANLAAFPFPIRDRIHNRSNPRSSHFHNFIQGHWGVFYGIVKPARGQDHRVDKPKLPKHCHNISEMGSVGTLAVALPLVSLGRGAADLFKIGWIQNGAGG